MNTNEIAFVVLLTAGFFLVVCIKGLFEALADYLFDRVRMPPNVADVQRTSIMALVVLVVCLISWSYI
jgi:high-affinity K+ transport system ATPase subunit B